MLLYKKLLLMTFGTTLVVSNFISRKTLDPIFLCQIEDMNGIH